MDFPEKADDYPDAHNFEYVPGYAFYVRHVDGLRLENIDVVLEGDDARPALVFDDVTNLDVDGFTERRTKPTDAPVMVLKDVSDAGIRACRPLHKSPAFMHLQGAVSRITAIGNELTTVGKLFTLGDGADASEVYEASNRMK